MNAQYFYTSSADSRKILRLIMVSTSLFQKIQLL